MAQLNSRGTLTRNRWDYFEHSNGWAFVFGSVATGAIGAYLANNSTATLQLDIYNITWFASISALWTVRLLVSPLTITPLTPTEMETHATQPDRATPPGVVGMFTAQAGDFATVQRMSNAQNGGIVAPIPGNPFMTLPPLWAIAVSCDTQTNPVELSMSVWYQEVLDNVAPAP